MATHNASKTAREALDQRLVPLGPPSRYAAPRLGWVRAIRDALDMTGAELAQRMGVTGPAVRSLEKNEVGGGAQLTSLRRAAEAMDCTLVYAFVPNSSLEQTVYRQARGILESQLSRVHQTMALEAQDEQDLPSSIQAQLEAIVESGRLWSRGDDQG